MSLKRADRLDVAAALVVPERLRAEPVRAQPRRQQEDSGDGEQGRSRARGHQISRQCRRTFKRQLANSTAKTRLQNRYSCATP